MLYPLEGKSYDVPRQYRSISMDKCPAPRMQLPPLHPWRRLFSSEFRSEEWAHPVIRPLPKQCTSEKETPLSDVPAEHTPRRAPAGADRERRLPLSWTATPASAAAPPEVGAANGLAFWYEQGAGTDWLRALPIGNGRLGAMVFGNVDVERLPWPVSATCRTAYGGAVR
ncbi:glycoside hydrolase N-terminal domain-containing protein [Dactylosporangium sp. NPDC051541]|uniref:glycoside hydrolase N-terminal domain-containing protein n=1 Tax=Dactylosporangium sp. NPDC051541 TaxID=3363977 RepID=UPI0037B27EB4